MRHLCRSLAIVCTNDRACFAFLFLLVCTNGYARAACTVLARLWTCSVYHESEDFLHLQWERPSRFNDGRQRVYVRCCYLYATVTRLAEGPRKQACCEAAACLLVLIYTFKRRHLKLLPVSCCRIVSAASEHAATAHTAAACCCRILWDARLSSHPSRVASATLPPLAGPLTLRPPAALAWPS